MTTERFNYRSFTKTEKRPSKIRRNFTHEVDVGVACPACDVVCPPLDHGAEWSCECGVVLQRWGNSLEVTVDDGRGGSERGGEVDR